MIIGITGFIGSGKDTVAKMLVEKGAVQGLHDSYLVQKLCVPILIRTFG